jgi:hypothetical protein
MNINEPRRGYAAVVTDPLVGHSEIVGWHDDIESAPARSRCTERLRQTSNGDSGLGNLEHSWRSSFFRQGRQPARRQMNKQEKGITMSASTTYFSCGASRKNHWLT